MESLDKICEMLGISEEELMERAIKQAIRPYLDENGEFSPTLYFYNGRKAFILRGKGKEVKLFFPDDKSTLWVEKNSDM